MKKRALIVILSIIYICPNFSETVRITSGDWPPYTSQQDISINYLEDITTQAFKEIGYVVEYGYFPWKRSFEYAKNGVWDASIGWLWNEERDSHFYYSAPISNLNFVILYLKSNPVKYENVDDLKKYRIGGVRGYSYGDEFDKYIKSNKLKYYVYNSDSQIINLVLKGRIDGVIIDSRVANYLIDSEYSQFADKIELGHVTASAEIYIIFSKNDRGKKLRDSFNQGLITLKESAQYEHNNR